MADGATADGARLAPDGVRVVFTGGGTGGHLYPALAIARALVRCAPSVAPLFVGAQRGIERELLPTTEFPHLLLPLHPFDRRRPWRNVRTVAGLASAWRTLGRTFAAGRPACVVGTGGYAAGAALAWGTRHGVPLVLHEPDGHPGKVTRAFASRAALLSLGFPEAAARLAPGAHTVVHDFGNPIVPPPRPHPDPGDARRALGVPPDTFVVLVSGGSQGARALNDAVAEWCAAGLDEGVSLIWSTGRAHFDAYAQHAGPRVLVRPYLDPIADAYAAADCAITRAGAMTVAELAAWGLPAVLVPLPTAAQDHQTVNARAVEAGGAGLVLPQAGLDGAALAATIGELRARPAVRAAMAAAALARGRPDAAARLADAIATDVLGIPAASTR